MGRLKAAMMDIGEEAMTYGVEPTASKYAMSTDDVQRDRNATGHRAMRGR